MKKTIILLAALLAASMAAQTIYAEKIVTVDFLVYKNGSVEEKSVKISEGTRSFHTIPGDYSLVALDGGRIVLANESVGLAFTRFSEPPTDMNYSRMIIKMRYSENMAEFRLYHKGQLLYTCRIDACVVNGVCDPHETHLSCPQDCPADKKDGICSKEKDGKCDPDCMEGMDPDCGMQTTALALAGQGEQDALLYGTVFCASAFAAALFGYRSCDGLKKGARLF